jgi:hypothetical protein
MMLNDETQQQQELDNCGLVKALQVWCVCIHERESSHITAVHHSLCSAPLHWAAVRNTAPVEQLSGLVSCSNS